MEKQKKLNKAIKKYQDWLRGKVSLGSSAPKYESYMDMISAQSDFQPIPAEQKEKLFY